MFSKSFTSLVCLFSAFAYVSSVSAAPISNTSSANSTSSSNGSSTSGPHFVIYSDNFVSGAAPSVDKIQGFNVFALSFLLTSGAADQALAWSQLDEQTRNTVKDSYQKAGIKLIVSAFGATELPTTSNVDPASTAKTMAAWVKKYNLDGIDVDYEDLGAMNAGDGKAEAWLETFTKTLRSELPQGQYILTHAPLAPWFAPQKWGGGGYLKVDKDVGSMIDWYNIQFYNQNDYTTCDSLISKSSSTWPKTSVLEIASSGVSMDKLVIGKPATQKDATNGFVDTQTLATCLQQAKAKNWNAGAMVWQYPNADASWIKTVRSKAFPA